MDKSYVTSRVQNAKVWNYFTQVGDLRVAECKQCNKRLSFRTSITNLKTHLRLVHVKHYCSYMSETNQVDVPMSKPEAVHPLRQNKGKWKPSSCSTSSSNSAPNSPQNSTSAPFDEKRIIDVMLIKMIIKTHQPLNIVDDTNFADFLTALNPNYEPPDGKTISDKLVPAIYNNCLRDRKKMVKEEAAHVCLTVDYWTSAASESFISVTARFITTSFDHESVMLACCHVNGDQSSKNLAEYIKQTLIMWNLTDKITGCVTNDTQTIACAVYLLNIRHYGCLAHKLNLCLQKATEIFEVPLKKTEDIVTYCKLVTDDEMPLLNAVTGQWNSTFAMVERFIQLKNKVLELLSDLEPTIARLTDGEWKALQQFTLILKPFERATQELISENYASGSKSVAVTTGLKMLMTHIIENKPESFDAIKDVVGVLQSEMEERFGSIEDEADLTICAVLDPRYKLDIFTDIQGESVKLHLLNEVETMIREEQHLDTVVQLKEEKDESDPEDLELWSHLNQSRKKRKSETDRNSRTTARLEVEAYLDDECGNIKADPCEWWKENNFKYPHLSKLFRTKYVTAAFVPRERIISNAGHLLTDRGVCLSATKTEQIVFLNANWKDTDYINYM